MTPIEKIMDLARWAPSGDNTQPWRFEFLNPNQVVIHTFDYSKETAQDYQGNYSQFAVGCLLETCRIAATRYGTLKIEQNENNFTLTLIPSTLSLDPLEPYIYPRVSNRFPYSRKALNDQLKDELGKVLDKGWSLAWFERESLFKIANLMFIFDLLAQPATKGIIDWNHATSKYRLADATLGLDSLNLWLARQIFKSPFLIKWVYHRLGGKFISAFFAFYLPSIRTGAHVALMPPYELKTREDYIKAGENFQRFWLECTKQNVSLQMESGPIIFSRYARDGKNPYEESKQKLLDSLFDKFKETFPNHQSMVMLSRIGFANPPPARADRLTLEELRYHE